MAPLQTVLTPEEIEEAHTLLSEKPPTILQDSFDIIKQQIFSGLPQIEFLMVRTVTCIYRSLLDVDSSIHSLGVE